MGGEGGGMMGDPGPGNPGDGPGDGGGKP
jgi:hypothetical protein